MVNTFGVLGYAAQGDALTVSLLEVTVHKVSNPKSGWMER